MRTVCMVFWVAAWLPLGCEQASHREHADRHTESTPPPALEEQPSRTVDGRAVYHARGTILWFEPGRVYLNHEEIAGFMDAMAMGFDVRDPTLLDGLAPGSSVEFRVVVVDDTFYVDQIHPVR